MGSHNWMQPCPYCGFEEMIVSTFNNFHFEIACPICGYGSWTEDKVPDNYNLELAKLKLAEMSTKEKEEATRLYYEDNIQFIARLKRKEDFQ